MTRPLVFLFGGQSSRDEVMFDRLEAVSAQAGERARARAQQVEPGFGSNHAIQVSVAAATLGWLEVVTNAGLEPVASAGLSLGEYAHLVEIGAIEADAAMGLVEVRGRLYDEGPSGCMAAIYPTPWDDLAPIVARVAGNDVAAAVFNSPTQTVIAGPRAAVEAVIEAADEELFAVGTIVEDHIPMHTARFAPVAEPFARALAAAPFTTGRRSYWANVLAEPVDPVPSRIREELARHVYQPVRWHETIDRLVQTYPDAVFLEVGPRTVLRDLMKRRWHPKVPTFAIDPVDAADPGAAVQAVLREVANA